MKNEPFVIERIYNAPIARVWKAITDASEMKQWYFNIPGFKAVPGFEFQFYGGSENQQYLHLCKITAVIPGKKLSYSWKYQGYPGDSLVTFELFEEAGKTRLKLTHEGLDSFPAGMPDFAKESFAKGWTEITGNYLKAFVEEPSIPA